MRLKRLLYSFYFFLQGKGIRDFDQASGCFDFFIFTRDLDDIEQDQFFDQTINFSLIHMDNVHGPLAERMVIDIRVCLGHEIQQAANGKQFPWAGGRVLASRFIRSRVMD